MVRQSLRNVQIPPLVWFLPTMVFKPPIVVTISLLPKLIKMSGHSVVLDQQHIRSAVGSISACTDVKPLLIVVCWSMVVMAWTFY